MISGVQVCYGSICDFDEAKGLYKVNLGADKIPTAWLSVVTPRSLNDTESWPLENGEPVACLLDMNAEHGVILGAIFNTSQKPDGGAKNKWRKTFSDGSFFEYDKAAHKYSLYVKSGEVNVKADSKVILDTPNAEITGKLKVTGDITTDGKLSAALDIESTGGDVTAGTVKLKLHMHPVPVAAPFTTVISSPPTP